MFLLKPEATVAKERATGVAEPRSDPQSAEVQEMIAQVQAVKWLQPHYVDGAGNLKLVFQMYIIDTPGGKRIAVDTCCGNDKRRDGNPVAHMQSRPFLDGMRSAGCPPETIDFVLCTHLHWDHVGFNTTLLDGVWVPTFPNARYLFAKKEMDIFGALAVASQEHPGDAEMMRDSVQPIIDAGLHMFVDSDHVLIDEPGCRVRLTPTEGHTLGHVSVAIESAGCNALVTGDCIHHPVQVARPNIGVWPDADSPCAADTRHRLLAEAAEQHTVIVGTHFSQPSACHVECLPCSAGYRLRPLSGAAPKM